MNLTDAATLTELIGAFGLLCCLGLFILELATGARRQSMSTLDLRSPKKRQMPIEQKRAA